MGFEPLAYKGLETGSREVVSHVIRQDKVESRTSCREQSSTVARLSLIPGRSSPHRFSLSSHRRSTLGMKVRSALRVDDAVTSVCPVLALLSPQKSAGT